MSSCRGCCTWRSCAATHAHGRLRAVDVTRRAARPGVVAVFTADDLGDYWRPAPLLVPPPPIPGWSSTSARRCRWLDDKVRHVGEPIAMVVAESRYVAEDALGDIVVDVDPLDAVVDLERALAPGAPRVHEHLALERRGHGFISEGRLRQPRARRPTSLLRVGSATTAAPRRRSRTARIVARGIRAPNS